MNLPPHLRKKQAAANAAPKSKYSDAAVKMLATALDDLHMIKFKQGWFTLVKYDYEVFEKKNEALRRELEEHAKAEKIEKPSTWISESTIIKIENKFKDMPIGQPEELKQSSDVKSAVKPKS